MPIEPQFIHVVQPDNEVVVGRAMNPLGASASTRSAQPQARTSTAAHSAVTSDASRADRIRTIMEAVANDIHPHADYAAVAARTRTLIHSAEQAEAEEGRMPTSGTGIAQSVHDGLALRRLLQVYEARACAYAIPGQVARGVALSGVSAASLYGAYTGVRRIIVQGLPNIHETAGPMAQGCSETAAGVLFFSGLVPLTRSFFSDAANQFRMRAEHLSSAKSYEKVLAHFVNPTAPPHMPSTTTETVPQVSTP